MNSHSRFVNNPLHTIVTLAPPNLTYEEKIADNPPLWTIFMGTLTQKNQSQLT